MEFNNLDSEGCNCFNQAEEDTVSKFALKITNTTLQEKNFKTYWEKGRRIDSDNCDKLCSLKSQSLSIIRNQKEEDNTVALYKKLFPFAPKYKTHCAILSFKKDSGLMKHTPSENNSLHYDFYKSDSFSLAKVGLIKLISLEDV